MSISSYDKNYVFYLLHKESCAERLYRVNGPTDLKNGLINDNDIFWIITSMKEPGYSIDGETIELRGSIIKVRERRYLDCFECAIVNLQDLFQYY